MAKAYMCDICKKFYKEDSSDQKYYIGKKMDAIFMYLDLCPDCSKKLSALIDGDAKIVMQEEEKDESNKEVHPDPRLFAMLYEDIWEQKEEKKEASDDSHRSIEIYNPNNEKTIKIESCSRPHYNYLDAVRYTDQYQKHGSNFL